MRKETVFFILSPLSSSTRLSNIGIKIHKLHEQTKKKEREREAGKKREKKKGRERGSVC